MKLKLDAARDLGMRENTEIFELCKIHCYQKVVFQSVEGRKFQKFMVRTSKKFQMREKFGNNPLDVKSFTGAAVLENCDEES